MRDGDRIIVPGIFYDKDGIRKLSSNAVKLYFQILILEDKFGGPFTYSCERFIQDLNMARATFFSCREELVQRGFISYKSKTERNKDGAVRQSVRYCVKED